MDLGELFAKFLFLFSIGGNLIFGRNPAPTPFIASPNSVPQIVSPSIAPTNKPIFIPKITPKPTITSTQIPTSNPTTTPNPQATSNTQTSFHLDSIIPENAYFTQPVTLKGSGFGSQKGSYNVYNELNQAQPIGVISSWSDTQINTTAPFYASNYTYTVEVVIADGRHSNKIPYKSGQGQPYVENISPSGAKPGDELVIKGSRFTTSQGSVDFYLNYPSKSASAQITSWTDAEIHLTIPSSLESGKEYGIQVVVVGASSSFKYYTLGS